MGFGQTPFVGILVGCVFGIKKKSEDDGWSRDNGGRWEVDGVG